MGDLNERGMNRRNFVAAATAAAGLAVLGPCGAPAARADDAPAPAPVDVGAQGDFAKDGLYGNWIKSNHIVVARENGKLYAMTSLCTHKGCDLTAAPNQLSCRCHHSMFSSDGAVTHGPAKRSLTRYAVSVAANGHVLVDPSQAFDDQHWDDPKCFVAIEAAK